MAGWARLQSDRLSCVSAGSLLALAAKPKGEAFDGLLRRVSGALGSNTLAATLTVQGSHLKDF